MSMSDTQNKLEESRFFLDKTRENVNDPRSFSFYLSAFLSSSRSVTWVMKKEFSCHKEFDKWYESKQKEMGDQFGFFKDKRNITVKERTLMPNKKVSVNIQENITINESVNVKVIRDGKVISEHTSMPGPNVGRSNDNTKEKEYEISWFFIEFPDKNLLELCEEYLGKLSKLVAECIQFFKSGED